MSAASPAIDAKLASSPKSKKKLFIIIAAVAALVLLGGGGAAFMMKKKAAEQAEAEADDEGHSSQAAAPKHDPKAVPIFAPLDPFTVNLADRNAERFAQVGVTLELHDAKVTDQIKNYMPAIRNNILMAIADRTAAELLERDGKAALALRIQREASRALGAEVPDDKDAGDDSHDEEDSDGKAKSKAKATEKKPKKKKKAAEPLPIKAVHFSNFIVQ
jgi:flagellar protein FliL